MKDPDKICTSLIYVHIFSKITEKQTASRLKTEKGTRRTEHMHIWENMGNFTPQKK
jgi:hypothetical protein